MSETADQIIDREIRVSEAARRKYYSDLRTRAERQLKEADEGLALLEKQLACNAAGKHKFEEVKGSGRMGSRFEEKCKHCGWIHTS